ncbi:MAG: hypothetical protein GY820_01935 [Gammaproteobacteria bacterium]|nr:hypothetical protein [Gammaproteobacteria bacterium]
MDLTKSGNLDTTALDVSGPMKPSIVTVSTYHREALKKDVIVNCLFVSAGKFVINSDCSVENILV